MEMSPGNWWVGWIRVVGGMDRGLSASRQKLEGNYVAFMLAGLFTDGTLQTVRDPTSLSAQR